MNMRGQLPRLLAIAGMCVVPLVVAVPASARTVSDALGVHGAGVADLPYQPSGDVRAAGSGCPPTATWDTSGQVLLGPGWTALAIRSGSCTAGTLLGYHRSAFYKYHATHGQFICRGHITYGYGTNTWYQDTYDYPHGWSWAGGTNQPFWDGSC